MRRAVVCLVFTVPDNINETLIGFKILETIFGEPTFCQKNRAIYTDLFTGLNFYEMIFNDFQICLPSV